MTAEQQFGELVDALADEPGVTPPHASARGFGSDALKVHGSIFAMVVYGQLVVKLPASRVRELIDDGTAGAFTAGKSRPLREWVSVPIEQYAAWEPLAREALDFVGSASSRRGAAG